MAELQTKKTGANVRDFLNGIEDERKRRDAKAVARIGSDLHTTQQGTQQAAESTRQMNEGLNLVKDRAAIQSTVPR